MLRPFLRGELGPAASSPAVAVTAVVFLGVLSGSFAQTCRGSDLQKSTNRAAVAAKKELCIALNKGRDNSQLRDKFLAFYEGKIVSAETLHPETFETGQIGALPSFRVVQVLGPDQMLVSIDSGIFKLTDVATTDVADRQTIRAADFFLVRETETYETVAGGTNTVYILEPVKGKMAAVEPCRTYPWYNPKGEVVVDGEFNGITGPNAVFSVNGQQSIFPLNKFTRGDRALMRILKDRYFKGQGEPQGTQPEAMPPRPIGID
jgi:hypothetical protein